MRFTVFVIHFFLSRSFALGLEDVPTLSHDFPKLFYFYGKHHKSTYSLFWTKMCKINMELQCVQSTVPRNLSRSSAVCPVVRRRRINLRRQSLAVDVAASRTARVVASHPSKRYHHRVRPSSLRNFTTRE